MSVRSALRLVLGAVAGAAVVGTAAVAFGVRGPAFAWITHFMLMAWTSAALQVAQPLLRSRWFAVRAWEPRVYRRLGVLQYGALLRRVGWEHATSGRSFDGTRSSLPDLERRTRMSEFAHVVIGSVGTGMVVVALAHHAWDAAGWLFAANVVLHAYPIMLQRVVRARLQRIRQPAHRGAAARPRRPRPPRRPAAIATGWRGDRRPDAGRRPCPGPAQRRA